MAEPARAASVHRFPLRVYYEDTDAAGIVYYANYLKFAERARTEMMRAAGIEHSRLREDEGIAFAVRRCSVEYVAPGRLDDRLEVETRVERISGAAIEAEQTVLRDAQVLARLRLQLVCIGPGGRAARLPKAVREAFSEASSLQPHKRERNG